MVPHCPLRVTLQPLFSAYTRLLKTHWMWAGERPQIILMLTTHPLQAVEFVDVLYIHSEEKLGWQKFSTLAAS